MKFVANCFSGTATLRLENGSDILMRDIAFGHRVLALNEQGDIVYSSVYLLPHTNWMQSKTRFLRVFFEGLTVRFLHRLSPIC